ncbi:MAG: hypothetical protein ACR2KO_14560 [Geodermatophilaceae bacterium]|nr:hypothetical protein [Geodermatophilaceae bacterium]
MRSTRVLIRIRVGVAIAAAAMLLPLVTAAGPAAVSAAAAPAPAQLTNLAHLDFLGDEVTPPEQANHTTYHVAGDPGLGVLWTYADANDDGTFTRVGGGEYDPVTNTWGQGAYNADDISRAAIVYLRHWQQFGSDSSRDTAFDLLRGLTYMQTASGPNAGNVVLWMQPDGTLNPSAEPPELPDPSDSGPSYWLARTVWALGEGYAAFQVEDPAFAGFLKERMELALDAVDRQVLTRYGTYQTVDGLQRPAWLITDGADASAEAVYGLAAYVEATGDPRARADLRKLSQGLALMTAGDDRTWPFGAIQPWALSRSVWHSWGDQMSGALARSSAVLDDRSFLATAIRQNAGFTPHLLAGSGPDHSWQPGPTNRSQIAYGADATLQNLLAVAQETGEASFRDLAGFAASWYFGNNPAGEPMYDPQTGVTFDGVEITGDINRNSGAESAIHGQLSMLALDAHPGVAIAAAVSQQRSRVSWQLQEAEDGRLSNAAQVVTPESAWTGEAEWSGGSYVELGQSGRVLQTVKLPAAGRYLLMPVFNRQQVPLMTVGTRSLVGRFPAGVVYQGGAGPQGVSAAPGYLDVGTSQLMEAVTAGSHVMLTQYVGDGTPAQLDAVLVQPEVEWLIVSGEGHGRALLHSFAVDQRSVTVTVPGDRRALVSVYNDRGRLASRTWTSGATVTVTVEPGGFTIVQR